MAMTPTTSILPLAANDPDITSTKELLQIKWMVGSCKSYVASVPTTATEADIAQFSKNMEPIVKLLF
ncbi:hypothetical protein SESBI_14150 [Sesbania bispinosa]|nr:hypothetical protein SESBI_14150 [Sesbania bispinosa]